MSNRTSRIVHVWSSRTFPFGDHRLVVRGVAGEWAKRDAVATLVAPEGTYQAGGFYPMGKPTAITLNGEPVAFDSRVEGGRDEREAVYLDFTGIEVSPDDEMSGVVGVAPAYQRAFDNKHGGPDGDDAISCVPQTTDPQTPDECRVTIKLPGGLELTPDEADDFAAALVRAARIGRVMEHEQLARLAGEEGDEAEYDYDADKTAA